MTLNNKGGLLLLTSIFVFLVIGSVFAFTVADMEFEDIYMYKEIQMKLNGAAPIHLTVAKMGAVGLYLGEKVTPAQIFDDVPKRIEIAYLQGMKKKDLIKMSNKGIKRNVGPLKFEELKSAIDALNLVYFDVESGDRYSVTYIPGEGSRIEYNGVLQKIIEGPDFAQAFFSIYIGVHPADKRTKSILLRDKTEYKL